MILLTNQIDLFDFFPLHFDLKLFQTFFISIIYIIFSNNLVAV